MLPDWLKNEDEIYNRMKYMIDDIRKNYEIYIKTNQLEDKSYWKYERKLYLDEPYIGIETDNNKLRPISIIIGNWERYYYIPLALEIYNSQDYPKDLIETIIVDDNSTDKANLLRIIKEQVKLYPELKIRFIQNYINKTFSPVGRINIGVRNSYHDIVIMHDNDIIPLGKNYLRGICHAHNIFMNVCCSPIPLGTNITMQEDDIVFSGYGVIKRLENMHAPSFSKELFSKIRGFDELHIGYGGHEGNLINRYATAGGKFAINTSIYSLLLPNFPKPLPPDSIPAGDGQYWQPGTIINDDDWGTSEKMEEINLYENK